MSFGISAAFRPSMEYVTKDFEACALPRMPEMPMKRAGEIPGVTDMRLWRRLFAHSALARSRWDLAGLVSLC